VEYQGKNTVAGMVMKKRINVSKQMRLLWLSAPSRVLNLIPSLLGIFAMLVVVIRNHH
jgi:hypothetical protein